MIRSVNELRGTALHATDGVIGDIHDVYFDDHQWTVRYYVVDTGTWLPGRKVLIPPHAVQPPTRGEIWLPVNLSKAQIENSPDIDTNRPVERRAETSLYDYYGWTPYWFPLEPAPPIRAAEDAASREHTVTSGEAGGDPNLRSAREVTGYHVVATDDEIGHIEDFLLEDQSARIRYVVVDTKNWLPGKHVLLAPRWIREVNWADSKVHVDMNRKAVEGSPQFTSIAQLDPQYEERLSGHYGYPIEWL